MRWALTPPFHPYRRSRTWVSSLARRPNNLRRSIFCCTGRLHALRRASRTLSGTLPCGVRTFLPLPTASCGRQRSSGRLHPLIVQGDGGVVQGFWNRRRGLGVDVVTGRGGRRAICVQLPVGQMPDSSWRTGNGKVLTRRSRRKDAKVAKERREGREGRAGDALVEMTDVLRLVGRSRVGLRQVSNGEKRGIAGGAAVAVGE
jgi:hypothetical protein